MGYYWDKGVQELENTAYGKKIQLENRIFTLVRKKRSWSAYNLR